MIRAVRVLIIMAFAAGACARPAVGGEARNSDSVAVAVRGSGITPCPPTCAWESIFSYSHASLSGPRAPWHEALLSIVHSFGGREAAVLEVIQSSRFNEWDRAVALDGYAGLWDGGYANVRAQFAPDAAFLPRVEAYAAIFHALRSGWEVSAGYRLRAYDADRIHVVGGSLGRYAGNWYVRANAQAIPMKGEVGANVSMHARFYLEPPRSFVEVAAGRGRGVEVVAAGPIIERTDTYHFSARLQTYVTRHLGFSVQGLFSDDDFFQRRVLVLGLMTRW